MCRWVSVCQVHTIAKSTGCNDCVPAKHEGAHMDVFAFAKSWHTFWTFCHAPLHAAFYVLYDHSPYTHLCVSTYLSANTSPAECSTCRRHARYRQPISVLHRAASAVRALVRHCIHVPCALRARAHGRCPRAGGAPAARRPRRPAHAAACHLQALAGLRAAARARPRRRAAAHARGPC